MRGDELRNMAAEIHKIAATASAERVKQASDVLDAAIALRILQKKVRTHA